MSVVSSSFAPIAFFVYNRVGHTRRTLDALLKNSLAGQSDLFVFCDGARREGDSSVMAVRKYVRSVTGFKSVTIVERETNVGLATSIIEGVTDVVGKHGSVIVLEDDLVTSPHFLLFMNTCLAQYQSVINAFSIAGWSPPTLLKAESKYSVTFLPRNCSWGWATWKDRWDSVDWDVLDYEEFKRSREKQNEFNRGGVDLSKMLHAQMRGNINSWSIRFCYSQCLQRKLTVFPISSYVENIGCDGSGVHCDTSIAQQSIVRGENQLLLPDVVEMDKAIVALFADFYRPAPFIYRAINKLSRIVLGKNVVTYETTAS